MALTAVQINEILKILQGFTEFSNVTYDADSRKISCFVTNPDRTYRKLLLSSIQQTLAKPWGASYNPPSTAKTGEVRISGLTIVVKDLKTDRKPKLKPIDIKPSITNVWLDATGMVNNVIAYVNKLDIAEDDRKIILELLKTAQSTSLSANLGSIKLGEIISAEFFEVLTAIKLAVLLKARDRETFKILGLPADYKSTDKILIKIPQQANFPLIDYYIYMGRSASEEDSMKISVKSKVTSPGTNTVKFPSMFEKTADIQRWYDALPSNQKTGQRGQRAIAQGMVSSYYNQEKNYVSRGPIKSLIQLIETDAASITALLNQRYGISDVKKFKNLLEISLTIHDARGTKAFEFSTADRGMTADYLELMKKFIAAGLAGRQGEIRATFTQFSFMCEDVLIKSSKKNSSTGYNFYQMFHDEVLKRRNVAYAVSTFNRGTIKYDFYSLVNWAQEYHDWLSLRTKNSLNAMDEAIGLDV